MEFGRDSRPQIVTRSARRERKRLGDYEKTGVGGGGNATKKRLAKWLTGYTVSRASHDPPSAVQTAAQPYLQLGSQIQYLWSLRAPYKSFLFQLLPQSVAFSSTEDELKKNCTGTLPSSNSGMMLAPRGNPLPQGPFDAASVSIRRGGPVHTPAVPVEARHAAGLGRRAAHLARRRELGLGGDAREGR